MNMDMDMDMDMKLNSDDSEKQILPFDVITSILKWLPIKNLVRFQIVSKEWHELITSRYILQNHRKCSKYSHSWFNIFNTSNHPNTSSSNTDSFKMIRGCEGILIFRSLSPDGKYCLWNPAIRLLLELPDPHKESFEFAFSYIPSSNTYKILSLYKESTGVIRYEVFTPGSHSKEWRRLYFPYQLQVNKRDKVMINPLVVSAGTVVHCIGTVKVGNESNVKIISLDMGTESFRVTTLLKDLEISRALDWNGKLGFAKLDGITLQVVVLEDYKKQIWGEKKSIQLPFMKDDDYKGKTLILMFAKDDDLWFYLNGEKIFTYTIGTREVDSKYNNTCKNVVTKSFYPYKPSLVKFDGMQPDTKLQKYRPHFLR